MFLLMKIQQRERFTIIPNNVSITDSWDCLYCLLDGTNNPQPTLNPLDKHLMPKFFNNKKHIKRIDVRESICFFFIQPYICRYIKRIFMEQLCYIHFELLNHKTQEGYWATDKGLQVKHLPEVISKSKGKTATGFYNTSNPQLSSSASFLRLNVLSSLNQQIN